MRLTSGRHGEFSTGLHWRGSAGLVAASVCWEAALYWRLRLLGLHGGFNLHGAEGGDAVSTSMAEMSGLAGLQLRDEGLQGLPTPLQAIESMAEQLAL